MTSRDRRESQPGHYRWDADVSLPVAVATAVAEFQERDPETLPPLQKAVDPDALAGLFSPPPDTPGGNGIGHVEFTYARCTVRVWSNGDIELRHRDGNRTASAQTREESSAGRPVPRERPGSALALDRTEPIEILVVEPESTRRPYFDDETTIGSLHTTDDAASASTILAEKQVDCVVCRHDPPVIDGVAVLSALRGDHPDLPVFLMTDTGEAIDASATDLVQLTDGESHERIVADRIASAIVRARERGMYEQLFERTNNGIAVHDPDTGEILEANRRFHELVGCDPNEKRSLTLRDILPANEAYTAAQLRERIRQTAEAPQTVEWRDRTTSSEIRWIEATLERTVLSGCERVLTCAHDITERKRYEDRFEALYRANRRLWEASDEHEIAEITVDTARDILDEHWVTMWSYDDDAGTLVPLAAAESVTPADDTREYDDEFGAIEDGTVEMQAFDEGETTVIGNYRSVDAPAHPEAPLGTLLLAPLGEYGQLQIGSRTVDPFDDRIRELIDILATNTEAALARVTRLVELERSRARLTRTEQLARVGGWELDLRTNGQTWTDGTRHIHEVGEEFEPTLQDGIEFYHPEDRGTIREKVERCRDTGEPYTVEARLVTAEGRERWVEAAGEAVEEDGEIVGLRGAIRDITDQKSREQQLSVLYRILRHNLRNELNVVQGFANKIDQDLERLDIPAEIDGREVEAFRRLVERMPDPDDDLERDIEALGKAITSLSELPLDEMHAHRDQLQEALENLMSIGDKAARLHDMIVRGKYESGECRLDTTIESVVGDLCQKYPDASVEIDDIEPLTVNGAPEKVTLLLQELLDNALRHTNIEEPTVDVRTERDGAGRVTVEVIDRGPGIPDAELEALRRGNEEALIHSSGLGLWLVNWLATHLDGHLAFEANEPRGTVVSLSLSTAGGVDSSNGA